MTQRKTLWSLVMDGVNCLKATEPLWGDSLLFTTHFPGVPGSQYMDPQLT